MFRPISIKLPWMISMVTYQTEEYAKCIDLSLLQHKQMRQLQIFLPELVFVDGEPEHKAPEP